MNQGPSESNVYYLPAPIEDLPLPPPIDYRGVSSRLRSAWWRLCLALTEIRSILRRPRRTEVDDYAGILFEDMEEAIERRRSLRSGPARVIDFAAARVRLRPTPDA